MADWSSSMQQSFKYYVVDPGTWGDIKLLDCIKSSTINRDLDTETLETATIEATELLGECYVRIYLETVQNGVKEKHPLGTFLVQTPSSTFDGKIENVSIDAYSPLLELKENQPPLGYYIPKDKDVMSMAYSLTKENVRAPVVKSESYAKNKFDFASDVTDSWLSFLSDLISNQSYGDVKGVSVTTYRYSLDEMSRILFAPDQSTESLQPVWTYDDGNSSILYPDISMDRDLYGIPNVVEVIYSNGFTSYHVISKNEDPNSPTSIVNRGREIVHRVLDANLIGYSTKEHVQKYADDLLKSLSTVERTITYSHGYCPVRIGDCVRINYSRAGLTDIKAKVISQTIECKTSCKVVEKAVYSIKLWG